MRSTMPLWIPLLLLTGCETAAGCKALPLPSYDRAFNQRLADELEAMPPGAASERAILDYAALRDAVRACRG